MAKSNTDEVEKVEEIQVPEITSSDASQVAPEAPPKLNYRVYPVSIGLLLGWCAQQQLVNLVSSILGNINEELGPEVTYTWIASSWSMTVAILWSIVGPLSDAIGRRWFFIIGNTFGLIGGIICCTANTINIVIVGSVFLGVGAASQQVAAAALAEIYPNKWRGYVQGILEIAPLPFSAMGSLIAHKMDQNLTWRWVYYLNIIITAVSGIILFIWYHPPVPHRELSRFQILKTIDFMGCGLFVLGLTSFLLGINWGAGEYAWKSAAVLVPLLVGIFILFGFGLWEAYRAKNPLFPQRLFKNTTGFLNVVIVTFISAIPLYALLSGWPLEESVLYTTDPTKIGIYGMPQGFGLEFGSIIGGLVIKWIGHTNLQLMAGAFITTLFTALTAVLTPASIKPAFAFLLFGGLGITYTQIIAIVMVQLGVEDEDIGKATGILSTARNTAGAIAISMYYSILRSRVASDLPERVTRAVVPLGLPLTSLPALFEGLTTSNQTLLELVPGVSPTIIEAAVEALKLSYAAAFRVIYYVALALGLVSVVCAYFTMDVTPRMTDHLAVDLKTVDHAHLFKGEEVEA